MRRDRKYRIGSIGGLVLLALLGLAAVTFPAASQAASGSLDRGFASAGLSSASFGDFDLTSEWAESAGLPDGSAYLLASSPFRLYKIGADGRPVESFGNSGVLKVRTLVKSRPVGWYQVLAAPEGKAVLIGKSGTNPELIVLGRLLADGSPDRSFGNDGFRFVTEGSWARGAVDHKGRILLASDRDNSVVRFRHSGGLDRSFGEAGTARPDLRYDYSGSYPYALAANATGVYVVASQRTYRLTSAGELDLGFGGGDGYVNRGGNRIGLTGDRIVLQYWGGKVDRLLTNGTPDPTYGPDGHGAAHGEAESNSNGALLADGSLIFVSEPTVVGGVRRFNLTRLDPNGFPDPTFAGDARLEAGWLDGGASPTLWTVAGRGAAVMGGQPGTAYFRLVDEDGIPAPDFGVDGIGSIRTALVANGNLSDSGQRRDRSYLTVGSLSEAGRHNYGIGVFSFRRNGKPDAGFGTNGRIVLQVPSMRWDPKPKLTLLPSGGAMVCAKVGKDSLVWKIGRNGKLADSFGNGGRLTLPFSSRCQDIAFDGKGAVLSAVDIEPGRRGLDLVRLRPDGALDPNYGVDGVAERTPMADLDYFWVHDTRLMTDRRGRTLLIVSNGDARYISRYTQAGVPDPRFGFEGKLHYGFDSVSQAKDGQKPIYLRGLKKIRGFALGRRGTIFITGSYGKRAFVAKLDSRGFPVRGYGRRGLVILPESNQSQAPYLRRPIHARANGIGVGRDGSVIVTGTSRPICRDPFGCSFPLMLKRIKPNGRVDRGFGNRVYRDIKSWPDASGQYVHFDGSKIVATGSITFAPDRRNFMIARFR